ncbi:MAG TPA: phage portal protein [Tepidisphaeraceae bacterium]|jgi:hypothetical protein
MNAMSPDKIVWHDLRRYVSPLVPDRFGFMTPEENARVERIRQNRLLFRGRHREYFVGESRTQFPVATLMVDGKERGVYVPYNLLGLITRKGADLLFGEHPSITSEDPAVAAAAEAVDRRSNLRRVLFDAAVTCAWAAEAYLEVITGNDRGAYVTTPAVDEIFPVGDIGPDGQHAEYRRYATTNVGTAESPIVLLLTTTYRAGEIARELWQLDRAGKRSLPLDLKSWPKFADVTPLPVEKTNLPHNTIVWVPNELVEGEAVGEYELSAIELQDLVNAKQSQLARVLAIHANPRMFFPTGSVDGDGNVRASAEAFFGDTKDAKPEYIEMAGNPQAAMTDRDFAVASLCVSCEWTPELLGIKNDATAESGRKMRLSASSPLAKIERRTAYWQPALQRVMALAACCELGRPIADDAVGVEIRDGLPEDEHDTAEIIATLRSAGAVSLRRALRMLGLDDAAIEDELDELKTETAAATPDVLLGEPAALPPEGDNPAPEADAA